METDIKKLYGVGPARAAAYAKLGVFTVGDLLMHYPRGYEDRGNVLPLSDCGPDGKHAVVLTVATEPKSTRIRGRMSLLKFRGYDESGTCEVTFFNQEYLKNVFTPGAEFRFYGKVEKKGNRYTMVSPAYEPMREDVLLPPLVSVYPLTEGLTQKQVSKDMKSAMVLAAAAGTADDLLPEDIRRRNGLCMQSYALRNIHMPDSFEALAAAKKRLIFEEFFIFALGLSIAKRVGEKSSAFPCTDGDISPLVNALPYELTNAQKRVIEQIREDMSKDLAMNRLVVGDVGCGKTVCAAAAMLIAVKSGRQAVLMAPTEILARQHHADLCRMFAPLGITCELLVGATSAAEKRRIYAGLSEADPDHRIHMVVGTQALLSEGVTFAAPGLVVTDEQHRFGVNQRAILAQKNRLSHLLVMSATPIPRSLALALYGDLSISAIDEMPAGRQRVDTFAVNEGYRDRLDNFIRKQVADGGQVYVVCPAVEDRDEDSPDLELGDIDGNGSVRSMAPLKSALAYTEEMKERFPELSIAFLHGKMKSREKDAVMKAFAEGQIQILVSTTVIEVGVNVPNASLMIVENAERFGLSQLHQLRGRVGRGTRKSYCILVSDSAPESTAYERLQIMRTCYDGFAIAKHDLEMRGPGDFLRSNTDSSIRQSGGIKFRLAALCDDNGLFQTAFSEAEGVIREDPGLVHHEALLRQVHRLFSPEEGTVN